MKKFQVMIAAAFVFAVMAIAAPAQAGHHGASCCAPEPVCCVKPAPPVNVTICVQDPCTCCTYEVQVCVPAECACEAPCLAGTRSGIFGRKILTYKWPCCGYCVDVVITKHGRVIVR